MPPSTPKTRNVASDAFLRSINLKLDAEAPERIAHFRPTTKTVGLVHALTAETVERAFFVVAPYGSGKSLTASYLLHILENRVGSHEALEEIEQRLAEVNRELSSRFKKRRRGKAKALVIPIAGHVESLPATLKATILESMKRLKLGRQARAIERQPSESMEDAIALLGIAREKALESGLDQILILWDEFGRHIEAVLSKGRHADLDHLQTLAEFASRSKDLPLTLGLFLHQSLLHYASSMPNSVRAEWTKVAGRFHQIQYVDDSKEIYRLVSEVVAARRSEPVPRGAAIGKQVDRCKELGIFADFTKKELRELLSEAYPLEPLTLFLLPRIAARVAQNERTLFSFLHQSTLDEPVAPHELYQYFADVMRSDTSVGGTYRPWVETESAIAKCGSSEEAHALQTACLIGLAVQGNRVRASRPLLVFGVAGYRSNDGADELVSSLVEQKLLLHRKHSDEVTIWHGTDVDLRSRLGEQKARRRGHFEVSDFLTKEAEPPVWRPVEYNDDFGVRRFLAGEYRDLETMKSHVSFELPFERLPVGTDGRILYLLAEDPDDLVEAEQIVADAATKRDADRLVFAIPSEPIALSDAALEVAALLEMQRDSELLGADPLVATELQQLTDDSRAHLQRLVDRLTLPGPSGPRFYHCGKELKARNARELRTRLSEVMRNVFPTTPKILNEMIVRNRPSAVIVNSRKKLTLGLLEKSGLENLGLEGFTPDVSIFRTVLLHTGLYRPTEDGRWSYAPPADIQDEGLREVWSLLQNFFTTPSERPKKPARLFEELREPPYGVRAGLLPVLFAAAMKAFPSAISLSRNGEYVVDVLPTVIEDICRNPDAYEVTVLDLDAGRTRYLRMIHEVFSPAGSYEVPESDLIRLCFDAIEAWKTQLPPAALSTRSLSEMGQALQSILKQRAEPVELLFEAIPGAFQTKIERVDDLRGALTSARTELLGVAGIYFEKAGSAIRRTLGFEGSGAESTREAARQWASCFPGSMIEQLTDGVAKGLLSRMLTDYDSDEQLIDSVSSLLVGRPVSRWDDGLVAIFAQKLLEVVRRVEESALDHEGSSLGESAAAEGLARLAEARLAELYGRLTSLVGEERASDAVQKLLDRELST